MAATAPTVENELRSSRSRLTKGGRRITYQMSVVQQPERARACGQGAKSTTDRRPVDPPPIIDLRIFEGEDGHLTDITFNYRANIFLFASLENARSSSQSRSGQPASGVPVLTGTPVAGISYLDRPNPAGYFIFPDLSVRHEGRYRLTFNLFEELKDPKDEDSMTQLPNNNTYIHGRCEVKTAPFTVFSAKKFPGLMESTSLSRMVADQGCRVRIRRDVRMRRRETKAQEKWDDYEDETAHERVKRDASPGEYAPPQAVTQAPAPPVAQASSTNNNSNNGNAYSSSDAIRQQDVTTPYQPQASNHQSQQQMTQHTPSTYPSYLQYDAAQMQHYMAQHPSFAQYPQQAAAYAYSNQPMLSYAPGYGYMPQQSMHQAPMYEQMQHHAVEYMPPPPPPPPAYPRQSITAATAYTGQAQSQQGNDMRQGQSSEQNYINQLSMGSMPIPAPPKGLPRLSNNGLYTGRVGNGSNGLQQQQTYPETPRNLQYYNQASSAQKRSYVAAFDSPPYEQQRMQYPPRPQTSTYSRPSEQEGPSSNDDQSSDAESLELEQLKMTYRRADGSERTRTWPQLRT